MADSLEGGCTCGAVRYRLRGAPMIVHCCHCTDCQTESGTAFALNAMYESDRVVLTKGAVETIDTPSESGEGQQIVRCPACKVALWSHYGGLYQKAAYVRVGTLDTPAVLPPDIHIFTRSKLPWMVLPEGVPTADAFYRRSEIWSAESLTRREALLAE
jgi:hypothetical protein